MKNIIPKKFEEDYNEDQLFDNSIWLDSKRASKYLGVSTNSLRIMVCRGQIKAYKLGRRLRFKESDLLKALSELPGGLR